MSEDHCPRCGTGLDGTEDAFPWCDLCWDEMHGGYQLDKDAVIRNILNAQARATMMFCDLHGCDKEAVETFEVRANAPIRMAICQGHADDLKAGLGSGAWTISDGVHLLSAGTHLN